MPDSAPHWQQVQLPAQQTNGAAFGIMELESKSPVTPTPAFSPHTLQVCMTAVPFWGLTAPSPLSAVNDHAMSTPTTTTTTAAATVIGTAYLLRQELQNWLCSRQQPLRSRGPAAADPLLTPRHAGVPWRPWLLVA